MSVGTFRERKNGLIELRFYYGDKRFSVYGQSKEECMENRYLKIAKLTEDRFRQEYGKIRGPAFAETVLRDHPENTVFLCALRYCEEKRKRKQLHKNGYESMVKSARFIGKSCIGNEQIEDLNEEMIERFRASVSGYSVYMVRRAVYLLQNIMKEGSDENGSKEEKKGAGRRRKSSQKR